MDGKKRSDEREDRQNKRDEREALRAEMADRDDYPEENS